MNFVRVEKEKKIYLEENDILPISAMIKFMSQNNSYSLKNQYVNYMKNPNKISAKNLISQLQTNASVDFLSIDEEGHIYYNPEYNPLVFNRRADNKEVIADAFLCLCIYTNPLSGLPSYTALSPEYCTYTMPEDAKIPEHPVPALSKSICTKPL